MQAFLREVVGNPRACMGTIASIQTFGSYGANFQPHVHALVTEGAFHVSRGSPPSFQSVPWWDLPTMTELIRRLCAQLPNPRQHMVCYGDHCANRTRGARSETALGVAPAVDDTSTERIRHRSWARLLKRVFDVDPLLCPQCQVEVRLVAVSGEFSVVDRTSAHLRRIGRN